MKTDSTILMEYDENLYLYRAVSEKCCTLISDLAKENDISIHDIRTRVKERESLQTKISLKAGKYNGIEEVTDIVGIRIITYFDDDVDKLAKIINEEFTIDEVNSVDKRKSADPDRFGYASLHYIVELSQERLNLTEYKNFTGIKFEIQIRSILQHAWAEIEHDLGYKSERGVPNEIKRDFSRISGLLELADREFIRIKEYLGRYASETEQHIENNKLNIPIDKVTLSEYLLKSKFIQELNSELKALGNYEMDEALDFELENNIKTLEYFNIKSILELESTFKENRNKLINFFQKWVSFSDSFSILTRDITLFYLYYVLLYENYSKERILEYLNHSKISSKYHSDIIRRFQILKDESYRP